MFIVHNVSMFSLKKKTKKKHCREFLISCVVLPVPELSSAFATVFNMTLHVLLVVTFLWMFFALVEIF